MAKRILGYTAFFLVMGCLFLYLYFPSDGVREYVETSVTRLSPQLSAQVGRVRPALPFAIALEDSRFHHESEPRTPVFSADTIRLVPSFRTILDRRPVFHFSCNAYGGTIDGRIAFQSFDLNAPIESDIKVTRLFLERYPLLGERLKRTCTGAISGAISYRFHTNNPLAGKGHADLSVHNGTLGFIRPVFGLDALRFDRIDLRMSLENQRVVVETLSFQGNQLNARGEGTIRLNSHFGRSILDLVVQIDPAPGLWEADPGGFTVAQLLMNQAGSGQLRVKIHGTIAQPRFQLP